MGGSGGSFFTRSKSPIVVADELRERAEASAKEFEATLSEEFARLLAKFNDRNPEKVRERLQEIKDVLHKEIEGSFDTLFGGSVSKHTYVDGISDVDSMLIIRGDLEQVNPRTIIDRVAQALHTRINDALEVRAGSVAVTVVYRDGQEIQLVPTVRDGERLGVPSWDKNKWSSIDPQQFREGLTKRNAECNGKLIPTLKLAKAINATLPEASRLSGYHIESIGVAAFRNYNDAKIPVRMLPHFFKKASELVLKPMTDRTGQSVHVDGYLGDANSSERIAASHMLRRIHQRMMSASAGHSRERWQDLFDER
jgi:hypothetical protein